MQDSLEGFHLSSQQLRLWSVAVRGQGMTPRAVARIEFHGELDPQALSAAASQLVARHEILRTAFRCLPGMSRPLQVIEEPAAPLIERRDFSGIDEQLAAVAVAQACIELQECELDLEVGVAWRMLCLRLGRDRHQLVWVLPALCCDAASMVNLTAELNQAYRQGAATLDEATQYADISSWQAELLEADEASEGRAFWRRLGAALPVLGDLPFERRQAESAAGERGTSRVRLPAVLVDALRVSAAAHGAEPKVLLAVVWATLLGRLLESSRVALGMLVEGRPYEEMVTAVGPYARWVPLDFPLPDEADFGALVESTAARLNELEDWLDSYDEHALATASEAADGHRFGFEFESLTAVVSADKFRLVERRWTSEPFELLLKVCLAAAGDSDAESHVELHWNSARWLGWELEQLPYWYRHLLTDAVERGGALTALAWGDAAPRRARLAALSSTAIDVGSDALLPRLVEHQARMTPQRWAVSSSQGELNYAELVERATRLARQLRARGVGQGDRVGIAVQRSLAMVVGMLAIWKTGAAYVPLDPSYPAERLRFMIEDSDLALLLTHEGGLADLDGFTDRCLLVDPAGVGEGSTAGGEGLPEVCSSAPAYVIYTSGSTGRPKGVVVAHRAIANRLSWMRRAQPLAADDRVLQKTPFSFDASIWEIFLPLISGAGLVLAEPGGQRDNAYLLATVVAQRITVLQLVPSQLAVFLQQPDIEEGCRGLRRMYCGGEAFAVHLAARFHQLCGAELYNLYGPTEASIDVAWQQSSGAMSDESGRAAWLPIGRALDNVRLLVVDRRLRQQPWGVSGELLIAGVGLAQGYHHRPGLTAERFCPDPAGVEVGGRGYHSGDRVRRLRDGGLEFLGRLDEQVKLRGFRIELGEINTLIERQPGVREAATVLHGDSMDQILATYVVPSDQQLEVESLGRVLAEWLPEHMIPTVFVELDTLPRQPNGKLDRGALPEPRRQRGEQVQWVAPRNSTEELLAGFWCELLGVDEVGIDDDFFALGGHSLLATRLIARVRELFQVEIKVAQLFERPTIAELAPEIADARGSKDATAAAIPPLRRAPRPVRIPLSFGQRRLWFLDRLQPGLVAYNLPVAIGLEGRLERSALEAALGEVVRRHEVLRTVFEQADGEPYQRLLAPNPVVLPWVDLEQLEAGDAEDEARLWLGEAAARPFDLRRGPLLRGLVLVLEADRHVAQLTLHHIVSDGWSNSLLVEELSTLYGAFIKARPSPLAELPVQYADYACWQHGWLAEEVLENELAYWRAALAGAPKELGLPTDRPRPAVQSFRGASCDLRLDEGLSQQLKNLALQSSATPFMVFVAAFQLLLGRYAGQRDLCIGTPVAGRGQLLSEGLIGLFVNTLVLRAELDPRQTWAELLTAVRATCLAAHDHQELPFECLVEAIESERSLSHSPVFQVMLALQNVPRASLDLPGLTLRALESDHRTSKMELTLVLAEADGCFSGSLEYNTDLFDGVTMRRLLGHFATLLGSVAAAPQSLLGELDTLSRAQRNQLLQEWNSRPQTDTSEPFSHRLFALRAAQQPKALAVADERGELSYGELDQLANRLAHQLVDLGVAADHVVAIMVERSPSLVVAILAVMKAGGAYLPLDPDHPSARLQLMLEDAQPTVLIATGATLGLLAEVALPVLRLDQEVGKAATKTPLGSPEVELLPSNLAYVIYTSGSTGRPKGTGLTHAGLANLAAWHRRTYAVEAADRATMVASQAFDASVWELWPYLTAGASLHVPGAAVRGAPAALFSWLGEQRISLSFLPTPLAEAMLEGVAPAGLALRALLIGGDRLHKMSGKPLPCRVVNHYGPTEDTVVSTWGEVPAETVSDPSIGRPIDQTSAYVVDADLRLLPIAARGELVLGGVGLARGYLRRPAATAAAFIPDPFSSQVGSRLYRSGDLVRLSVAGDLEFLGRRDHQIKVRGFRIEPGEIEATLMAVPGVREALVVARKAAGGGHRLVAYIVPDEPSVDPESAAEGLRQVLRAALPDYMVPSALVALEALPLSPNGKLDRGALPEPELLGRGSYVEPQTPTEQSLAKIWAEVLELDRVGAEDNFFALGGHSLIALKVVSRVLGQFAVELPVRDLFAAATLAELAERLDQLTLESVDTDELAMLLAQVEEEGDAESLAGEVEKAGVKG